MGCHSGQKCFFFPLAIVWHAIRDKTLFYPLFLYGTPSGSKIPPLSFASCMISHPGIYFLRIRHSTPFVTCLYIIIAYNYIIIIIITTVLIKRIYNTAIASLCAGKGKNEKC